MAYQHYVKIWYPAFCDCYTFLERKYCHHILAINRLNLANIAIDPGYEEPAPARRLVVRKLKQGRPKKMKSKALIKDK